VADRDIRDFAEVFIWKQAATFRSGLRDARVIWRRRASRFWPRMTASLIRVAASQNLGVAAFSTTQMAYSYSLSPIFIPAP
jgi:hypothetical protein